MATTLKTLRARVRRRPDDGAAAAALGLAHAQRGELTESIAALRTAARMAPKDAAIRADLALILDESGDAEGAEAQLRAAAALDPSRADVWCRLGSLRDRAPDGAAEARDLFVRAIASDSGYIPAYGELFRQYLAHGSIATAAVEAARALHGRGRPEPFDQALACAASLHGRHEECLALSDRVLRQRPGDRLVLIARADSCVAMKDIDGASASYEAAVRWHPTDELAARMLLTHSIRLDRWEEARARFRTLWDALHERYADGVQTWDGAPVPGERLLLKHERPVLVKKEAGYGDLIQSIRFASIANNLGMRVVIECPHTLIALLRTAAGVESVTRPFERGWRVRYRSPWMHIGLLIAPFGVAGNVAYLRVPPHHRAKWRARFAQRERRRERVATGDVVRVGVAWSVGADHPDPLRMRSMPFEQLRPLTEIPGLRLYSLQVGSEAANLKATVCGRAFVDLGSQFDDFADTAAAVEALDLVISVDTSVAHVAGALGVPCWVPLPYCSCFRWGLKGTKTPWYDSLRLFRQSSPARWDEVISEICNELRTLLSRRGGAALAIEDGDAGPRRVEMLGAPSRS